MPPARFLEHGQLEHGQEDRPCASGSGTQQLSHKIPLMDGEDYLVSAALLARGQANNALVADLASRFQRSLPAYVKVKRKGWRKRKQVKALSIDLGPERFRIENDPRGPRAWIDHIVRGICLKSEPLDVETWLAQLANALSQEATKSVEARLAIQDFLS